MPARRTRTRAQPGRRVGSGLQTTVRACFFVMKASTWALLLTKKFQIGNFKFQMEATATAEEAERVTESIGVRRPAGAFGKIHWHAAAIAAARAGSSSGNTVRRS